MSFSRRTLLASLSTDTAMRVAAVASPESEIAAASTAATLGEANHRTIDPAAAIDTRGVRQIKPAEA